MRHCFERTSDITDNCTDTRTIRSQLKLNLLGDFWEYHKFWARYLRTGVPVFQVQHQGPVKPCILC